jgi:hypothetical protein
MRLKDAVFESRVTQESDGVLTILDVDQSSCPPMLLRPRPKSPGVLDDYLESTVSDPDNYTYKHYVPSLVSVLWNSTIKEVVIKPACKPILMVAAFLPGPEVSTS